MQWSMSPRTLRLVAALLGLVAIGAFVMGVMSAPQRGGRMPGQRAADEQVSAPAIQATDATPLAEERIEGPPPPPELSPEEKAKLEEEKKAKEEAEALAKAAADQAAIGTPAPAPAPVDRVGDLLDSVTPPPEEPPH